MSEFKKVKLEDERYDINDSSLTKFDIHSYPFFSDDVKYNKDVTASHGKDNSFSLLLQKIDLGIDTKLKELNKKCIYFKKECDKEKLNFKKYSILTDLVKKELIKSEFSERTTESCDIYKNLILKENKLSGNFDFSLSKVNPGTIKFKDLRMLIKNIENNLKSQCQKLATFYYGEEPLDKSDDALLNKGIMLTNNFKLASDTESIPNQSLYLEIQLKMEELNRIVEENTLLLKDIITRDLIHSIIPHSNIYSEYLLNLTSSILLKYRLLSYQIYLSTYNDSTLEKLKSTCFSLQKEENELHQKISHYQEQLNNYHNAGESFAKLVKEYHTTLLKIDQIQSDITRLTRS